MKLMSRPLCSCVKSICYPMDWVGTRAGVDKVAKTQLLTPAGYTGRFIMYSGITKIYYRKTVGHVFTKPIQIEGTTQHFFPP